MKTLLIGIYQVYAWLIFVPLALLWSFLCGWTAVIAAKLISPGFASRKVGGVWARVISFFTPMLVTVEGEHNYDQQHSYVVVCNHVSQYDILLVYGWLDLDLRWVMKKELRKLPGIGPACEAVGHIFVDRSKPEAARQSINDALHKLGDGVGVLFFPEGTRSIDGRLKRFKTGAFRTAVDESLPVLPVSLVGTEKIMPAKSKRIRPGRVRMVVHAPIPPGQFTARELMDKSRSAIESALPESQHST